MCGICGFLSLNGDYNVTEDILRQMTSAQRHRGPDDEGYLCEAGVGLGFRRLAILDLTPACHQPMSNEDGTFWLVFNVEIYNFQDLVPTLEQAGHRFRSRSDSEVIIYFYEQWGTECLQLFFFQAEDGIRDPLVTGVKTCALPIWCCSGRSGLPFTSRCSADTRPPVPL